MPTPGDSLSEHAFRVSSQHPSRARQAVRPQFKDRDNSADAGDPHGRSGESRAKKKRLGPSLESTPQQKRPSRVPLAFADIISDESLGSDEGAAGLASDFDSDNDTNIITGEVQESPRDFTQAENPDEAVIESSTTIETERGEVAKVQNTSDDSIDRPNLSAGTTSMIIPETVVSVDSDVGVTQKSAKSPEFYRLQNEVICFLRAQTGSAATLRNFITKKGINIPTKTSAALETMLETYVVAQEGQVSSPDDMEIRFRRLASAKEPSTEKFMTMLWSEIMKSSWSRSTDNRLSVFNGELYSPSWVELAKLISRHWFVFLTAYCIIIKPGYEDGEWLNLKTYLPFSFNSSRQSSRQSSTTAGSSLSINKADIMYRHRKPNSVVVVPERDANLAKKLTPRALALVDITARRIARYRAGPKDQPKQGRRHAWTAQKEVACFITKKLRALIPHSLLGSQDNFDAFAASVRQFIKLPGFSKMPLTFALRGIKLIHIPWMSEVAPNARYAALLVVMDWLFRGLVNPLLAQHFYLTEMSGNMASMYYFIHNRWRTEIERPAKRKLLDQLGGLQAIESSSDGITWRFAPKRDGGVRPIINLKAVNEALKAAHLVLHHTLRPSPTQLASWQDWVPLLYNWRARHKSGHYYVVKVDISGCYENANLEKLKEIVNSRLDQGRDVYRLYTKRILDIRNKSSLIREAAATANGLTPLTHRISVDDFGHNGKNQIVTQTPPYVLVDGDAILEDITSLFTELRLRVGDQKAVRFTQGIPQGSACSLDLCNILLDDLVETRLSRFSHCPNSLLLRYVDDFLFVSTQESQARLFLDAMIAGFEDYGTYTKPEKTATNLGLRDRDHDDDDTERGRKTPPLSIQFLGYDLDPSTLEVSPRRAQCEVAMRSLAASLRRLDMETEGILRVLRSFRRSDQYAPRTVASKVVPMFGTSVAERHRLWRHKLGISADKSKAAVVREVFDRKLRNLVGPNDYGWAWNSYKRAVTRRLGDAIGVA